MTTGPSVLVLQRRLVAKSIERRGSDADAPAGGHGRESTDRMDTSEVQSEHLFTTDSGDAT